MNFEPPERLLRVRDLDPEVNRQWHGPCCWSEPVRAASRSRATRRGKTGRSAAPSARAGPSTTPSTTRSPASIYAAAASEWLGSAVWRSGDLGESWEHSSEGIGYGDDDPRKVSKVSSLAVADGRVLVGVEAPGIFASRRRRRDVVAADDPLRTAGQRGVGRPGEPAAGAPRHLGDHVRPGRPAARLDDRAGRRRLRVDERRHGVDAAQPGPARRLAAGARGGRLLRPPARAVAGRSEPACTSRITWACTAATTAAHSWTEITDGLPTEFGFARRGAPARPRHVLRHPARPGPRPDDARGQGGRLAHPRRRRELAAAGAGPAAARRVPRRAARGDVDRLLRRARPLLRDEHRPDLRQHRRRRQLARDRGYLPPIWSVEVAVDRRAMADLHLPTTLTPLFPDLPRSVEVEAATVDGAIDEPRPALAGPARPTLRAGPGASAAHPRLRRPRARRTRHAARGAIARECHRCDLRRLTGPPRRIGAQLVAVVSGPGAAYDRLDPRQEEKHAPFHPKPRRSRRRDDRRRRARSVRRSVERPCDDRSRPSGRHAQAARQVGRRARSTRRSTTPFRTGSSTRRRYDGLLAFKKAGGERRVPGRPRHRPEHPDADERRQELGVQDPQGDQVLERPDGDAERRRGLVPSHLQGQEPHLGNVLRRHRRRAGVPRDARRPAR